MNEQTSNNSRPKSWLAGSALLGLVAVVYWPVAGYEFVNWDDPWYVVNNPLIKSWHPANLWRMATEISVKNYAPLTTFSLLVDHTLFGLNPGGYHLHNVVLHAINVLLVCALVTRLTGHRAAGLMTAALFAVHPVQIETVAWVSSRKTLLCSLYMLASGLCWLRQERTGKHEAWGILFLGLALLTKAAAIVMPPIVVAYDVLYARKRLSEAVPRQIIPMFLCVVLLNITMSAQNLYMGGVRGHMDLGKLHILGIDSVLLWRYVGMLIAPVNLSLLYDPPTQRIAAAVTYSIVGWSLVAGLCWYWRKTRPGFAFALLCWFCLLAPVLNLFPITTLMNDRYLYLPCLCWFAMLSTAGVRMMASAGCFSSIEEEGRVGRFALNAMAAVSVVILICGYAAVSMQRLPVWRNDFALWQRTVQQVPQLAVVQIQWADALHREGRDSAALATLHVALAKTNPDQPDRERIQDRMVEWKQEQTAFNAPRTLPVSVVNDLEPCEECERVD